MKLETKFWHKVKKNTPKIDWVRIESWASFGVPDLLGYHDSCGFFMCELKIQRGNKIIFSPHQMLFHMTRKFRNFILVEFHDNQQNAPAPRSIKLYESSEIQKLQSNIPDAKIAAQDDWTAIQATLLGETTNVL